MKKILYILMFLFIFSCLDVDAIEKCTTSELARLKELANNVEFKYEYEIFDDKLTDLDEYVFKSVSYNVTALNLSEDLIVVLDDSDEEIRFTKEEPTIQDFANGETFKVKILAYTRNLCAGRVILTKSIKLPTINVYSEYKECNEYPKFKYCEENKKFDITEEEFFDSLEEYKNTYKEEDDIFIDDIVKNSNFNFYIILVITIIVIIIIIFLIIRRKRKRNDLI